MMHVAVIYRSEDHSTPVLDVNTCLSCYGGSTQSEYSTKHLCTANNKPSDFCITSPEFKCSPTLGYLSFHHDVYSLD